MRMTQVEERCFYEHSKENGFKRPHGAVEKKKPQNTGVVFWGLKKNQPNAGGERG
jgi:hypothetical protein